jgi:hypothetical protein
MHILHNQHNNASMIHIHLEKNTKNKQTKNQCQLLLKSQLTIINIVDHNFQKKKTKKEIEHKVYIIFFHFHHQLSNSYHLSKFRRLMLLFHSIKVYQPNFYATIYDQPWLDGATIECHWWKRWKNKWQKIDT